MGLNNVVKSLEKGFKFGGTVSLEKDAFDTIGRLLNIYVKQYGLNEKDNRKSSLGLIGSEIYGISKRFSEVTEKARKSGKVELLPMKDMKSIYEILSLASNGKGLGFKTVEVEMPKEEKVIIGYSAWVKDRASGEDYCVGVRKTERDAEDLAREHNDWVREDCWTRPVYKGDTLYIVRD